MIKKVLFYIIFPLFLGGTLYIVFRPTNLIMFSWFDTVGLTNLIESIRQESFQEPLSEWFIYSLPYGLWLYAFIFTLVLIWGIQLKTNNILWFLTPIIIGVSGELGQYFNIIPGTFDFIDLITCVIFSIIPFLIIKSFNIEHQIIELNYIKHLLSVIGCLCFIILATGSGPADAVQDLYIETEKDPIEKERMRKSEDFYQQHGETYPSQEQGDSIN